MSNLLLVTHTVFTAASFVLNNKGAFIYRALPVMIATFLLETAPAYLNINIAAVLPFIEPFIYAIFAVSWHRFTVLPEVRSSKAFPLRIGLRELKFGALSIAVTLLIGIAVSTALLSLPFELAAIILILLGLWLGVSFIFLFPAIALDQRIRPKHFIKVGTELAPSTVLAMVICCIYLGIVSMAIFAALWLIGDALSPIAAVILGTIGLNVIAIPLLLAIGTSTASLLFKEMIGLDGTIPEDIEETATN